MANIFQESSFEEVVDYGAFGTAVRCKWSVKPLNTVALVHNAFDINISDTELLLSLNHKNVIQYAKIDPDHMQLEYADCGSLQQLLHGDEQKEYSLRNALDWMHQAAKGFRYLHLWIHPISINYNLTPDFLMLTNNYRHLKILVLPSKCKEYSPMATNRRSQRIDYTGSTDICTMGITIWELLTRKKPFYHTDYTTDEIFEAVLRGERPSITNIKISITDELKRLIQNCWDSNPYKRPFIQEVIHTLNHILTQEDTDLDQLLKANIGAIVDFEDIKICKKIREDAFGISHKAMWFGKEKTVRKFKDIAEQWLQHQSFVQEIRRNIELNNKYLVKIYGASMGNESIYLISDYSDRRSLLDYLHGEEQRKYSVTRAINWITDAAEGAYFLNILRQSNYVFMNYILTPQNMILFNNFTQLKISDYCCPFDAEIMLKSTSEVAYIAPEVLRTKRFTYQSDAYSLGIILWEVLTRKKPYYTVMDVLPQNLLKIIQVTGMRPTFSDIRKLELETLEDFIELCWHQDELKRPDPHIWFVHLDRHCTDTNNGDKIIGTYEKLNYEDIEFIEAIGSGGYGIVYKAKWLQNVVAVKIYKNMKETNFRHEAKQLARTNHKNIIKLYGICDHNGSAYLVISHAECGSLYSYLHGDERNEYTMARAIDWMIQLTQGINHLHSMKPKPLIHRDLKSHNLLLSKNYQKLKIGDFGTVTDLKSLMTCERGTAAYIAPEVLTGNKYTEKCDIYSFGIVLWEVMARRKPFHHMENQTACAIIYQASNGKRPTLGDLIPNSEELRTLIAHCWHQDPEKRPSVKQIKLNNIPCADISIRVLR
ncbi:dual specificity protein kinase zak2-like [Drosophila navojoa]|uniref:dual specificity protein kinase zak2-like n=1 Tax=Drosophila navojoa TaxID=7232 RepID=UPI0011BF85B8|nr:dual specificity protein kinase zak2-like [Drosophila navojoa]